MVDQTPAAPAAPEGNRIPVDIAEEMRGSYLAYAMSVIVGRALPDVRDGLKPVHRRVLFAMHEQRNYYNTAYKKSARIVGDVIGKYHPHGDQSVYFTIVRMAQDFSLRYLLVDGQGNFGSVDGDMPAAMRYTEVRMTRLAGELITDIDKETIDWQPNYDGSEREPTVLPAAFPNLLVNGSNGIAVGMATNIPPHNMSEIIAATIAVIENPDLSTRELMQYVPGPDFPTGGTIYGRAGIYSAYDTGRGKMQVRAVCEFEYDDKGDEKAIIVKELPYQVNKAELIIYIADLVRDKKIDGIRDLRDESDREGMRIVIELKRGAMGQIVLNQLYKMTAMQSTFGIINLAIVSGQPKILTLKELLIHFVNHRRDVVTRRCRYELVRARDRAHLLEGYLRAIDIIDEIVQLIKASASPQDAREQLVAKYQFTEVQAQAILDLTLKRLTGLERDKIAEELDELKKRIAELEAILASDALLMQLIVDELKRIGDMFGDARRTQIVDASGEIAIEDLISDEPMVVTITTTGYIKRTPLTEYRTQRRGGRGRSGMSTKDEDNVSHLFVATAHALLLIFTDRGQVYPLKVWEVPAGSITSSGKAIINLLQVEQGEKVRTVVPVESLDDPSRYLVFATRAGQVKRTALEQFKNIRSSGLRAINLADDDDLIGVKVAADGDSILLATAHGMVIVFHIDQARPMGRATQGTRGVRLRKADYVVALDIVSGLEGDGEGEGEGDGGDEREDVEPEAEPVETEVEEAGDGTEEVVDESESTVLFVTKNGFGKRLALKHLRTQKRGGLGLRALKYNERNGELVATEVVQSADDLMVVTDGGTIVRIPIAQIRAYSRSAKGVRIIDVRGEQVVASYSVPASDAEPTVPEAVKQAAAQTEAIDKDLDDLMGTSGNEDE